uniref:Uncharacterized protein n=1 Tax=Oryctolagus cuniculus TaxID=9986 RepID=A0A5F9CQW3_RABIT
MIIAKFNEVQNSDGMILNVCKDKSFGDEKILNGNRPSSAASAFKVPEPKTSRNPVNSARKPGSAGGPKVGGASKRGSGAVDKEDFIKAFTDKAIHNADADAEARVETRNTYMGLRTYFLVELRHCIIPLNNLIKRVFKPA